MKKQFSHQMYFIQFFFYLIIFGDGIFHRLNHYFFFFIFYQETNCFVTKFYLRLLINLIVTKHFITNYFYSIISKLLVIKKCRRQHLLFQSNFLFSFISFDINLSLHYQNLIVKQHIYKQIIYPYNPKVNKTSIRFNSSIQAVCHIK